MKSQTETQGAANQDVSSLKASTINNSDIAKTATESSTTDERQRSATNLMRPETTHMGQTIKNKSKKCQMYKVTLPPDLPEKISTHPLHESHVAFLVSINNKTEMSKLYIQAVLDFLNNSNVPKVTILLGGFLRRHNFWQHDKYQATASAMPTKEEMETYALNLETDWLKENQSTDQYQKLKRKLGNRLNILTWQAFLQSPNYDAVNKEQLSQFNQDSNYRHDIVANTEAHLEVTCRHKQIQEKDLKLAKESSLKFVLEEMPLLSPKVLNVDWLLYDAKMSKPLETAYKFLNGLKSDNELLNKSRWLTLKGKTITTTPPAAVPVGYSNMVVSSVTPKGTRKIVQLSQKADYAPPLSATVATASNQQNIKTGMEPAFMQQPLMHVETNFDTTNPLLPLAEGFINTPVDSPSSDTKLIKEATRNTFKATSKSASNSPSRKQHAGDELSKKLQDLEAQLKEIDQHKALKLRDTVKQIQELTTAMSIQGDIEDETSVAVDSLPTKPALRRALVH